MLNPAQVVTTTTLFYRTQIIGQLQGGTVLYDQSFALPYADPTVQAGQTAAMLAVTTAGGPGVVIGAPMLTDTAQTVTSTSVTTYTLVGTTLSSQTALAIGPDSLLIGQRTLCTGLSGLPSTTAPSCSIGTATAFTVESGTTNVNINLNTTYTVDQMTQITELLQLFEQYTITGIVQAVGSVHAAVQGGAWDLGQRLLRRMGDEAARPRGFALPSGTTISTMGDTGVQHYGWVEGYATRGRVDATASTDAEARDAAGLALGLTWVAPAGLTWGFALDRGQGNLDIAAAGESADISLTQAALMAGFDRGEGFAHGVLSFGTGDVKASTTLGVPTTADYSLRTTGLMVEAGRHLRLGDWQISPAAGADWLSVRSDAFSAGNITADAYSAERTRVFAGVAASRDWVRSDGVLKLDASLRVTHVVAGQVRMLPVNFGGNDLTVTAGPQGRTGIDLGLGLAWQRDGMEARIDYIGRFHDGARDNSLTAGVTYRW